MSNATSCTSAKTEIEEFVCPDFNPSIGYRGFIERLRLARLKCGLSIADMADEVGLSLRLAYEFENLTAPLPFEWLEVWCEAVGVPFEDFLAIYWADEREWQERNYAQEAQLEVEEQAPAPSSENRGFSFLATLRSAFERTFLCFHSRFSTPKETLE